MKLKDPIQLCSDGLCTPASPMKDVSEGVYVRLPDIAELGSLPSCGEITFKYTRKNVVLEGVDDLSASIMLSAILAVKADPDAEDAPKDDTVDRLFEEASKAEAGETGGEE